MSPILQSALLISAIGMGLVFAGIILLWGLMALLVSLSAGRQLAAPPIAGAKADRSAPPAGPSPGEEDRAAPDHQEDGLREQAAAVAVAVALAMDAEATGASPPQSAWGGFSPWQSVMRSHQLKSRQERGRLR